MAETLLSPGVLARENDSSFVTAQPIQAGAAIVGPTPKGPVEKPKLVTSYSQYKAIFGSTLESGSQQYSYMTSIGAFNYFQNGGDSLLVTRVTSGSFTAATSTTVHNNINTSSNSFQLTTLSEGTIMNSSGSLTSGGALASGSIDNLRWEITGVNTSSGVFSLLIRRGNDTTNQKTVLETWSNLSLDPKADNYIEKVIGNQYKAKATDGSTVYLNTVGEYVNRSKYVRVSAVNKQTLDYIGNNGAIRVASASGSLPAVQSGSFDGATGALVTGGNTYFDQIGTVSQGLTVTAYADAISMLENKDEYVFNIVSAPGLVYATSGHSAQLDSIISLAENRGDCIAVVDLVEHGATVSNTTGAAASVNSSYTSTYWPWLQMQSGTGKNVWVPASVVIPGVYAFTDGASAPWFAPAGLTRGGIGDVIQPERKLTRSQRDELYSANVNPIATFPGAGINVFGQKTLQKKKSALDRVNVRRLLIELKKFVGDASRGLVFEQNTNTTRNSFLAQVNPYLESVVQRQGLYAYRVVMDDTNNTPDTIDRNQLIGQIYIQPAKTVEFIVLDFTIEPSGATFGA